MDQAENPAKDFKCAHCLQFSSDPKLLNCFHTFCYDCLTKRANADEQKHPFISCPICTLVTFVPAGGVQSLQTVKRLNFHCDEHESSKLESYCRTCEKPICFQCSLGSHSNHKCVSVTEVYPTVREDVMASMKSISDCFAAVSKAVIRLNSLETEIPEKKVQAEAAIANMIGIIHDTLDSRHNELLKQLSAIVQNRLGDIAVQKNHLSIVQAQLSSCLGFIKESLRTSSNEDILSMRDFIQKQVRILLDGYDKSSLEAGDGFYLKISASPQDLMEQCSEFARILVPSDDPSSVDHSLTSTRKLPNNRRFTNLLTQRLGTPILTISGVLGPCGVAISCEGEIFIAEGCASCISVFNESGKKLRSFGTSGEDLGQLSCPCELDIDDHGDILVVDGCNHRIQKFTSNGKFLAAVGGKGNGLLQFCEPDGIAINPINKKIYVVDNNAHRIQVLNPDLTFYAMFGKEGDKSACLHYPWGVACDESGDVFVTDSGNCSVKVFTMEGKFLREFGSPGDGDGNLLWPTGISVSSDGIVHISDYGNKRVSLFTSDGQYLKRFGRKGHRIGEFGNIRGIFVDRSGLICVCDTDNNRVVFF